jgi:hypothetical protein
VTRCVWEAVVLVNVVLWILSTKLGTLRPALRHRQQVLRLQQVRRHAGGAAGGGAEAVEQGALAVPAQDHLRGHQDPLPLRVLHHGMRV